MYRKTFKLSTLAALLIAANAAYAQENAVPPQSEADNAGTSSAIATVTVSGTSRSTRTENKNSYTTSAMRTTTGLALSPRETPQSVSVITKSQLNDRGISNMEDALKTTTGVNVVKDSGRYRYYSRGFPIDRIEEDGVATTVTAGASGNPYRDAQSMTDLAIYDHIEVVRGATGLTQGNGEPGGTINAVRKKPTAQRQIQGSALVDRFGRLRTEADVSGSLNENKTLRGRAVAVLERNRSFKDDVHGHGGLIYGVMDADAGENTKITFGGMYQDKTEMPDYFGIPMGLNGAEAGLPRDTYLGFNWNEARFKKFNAFAEVEHHFNDDWKLTGRLNYIKNKSDSRFGAITNLSTSYQGLSPGGTLAVNNLQNYKNKGYQFSGGLNLNGKYQLFGQSHDLFAGYTYSNENTDTLWRRIRNSTRYDPFTFQGNEVPSPNWDTDFNDRLSYDSKIVSHGLMFGTRFNPTDRLHIIAGTRWTHWKSSSGTYYDIWNNRPDTDTDKKDEAKRSRFVPYLGITFDITKQQSVYASYTSIFKPQSSTDYNYKILPPMLGNNYEIGWKGEWMNRKLNTSVALFQVEQKNRAVAFTELSTNRVYFEPSGKVVSRGIDAEISGKLNDNWQLFAGYTLNNSKYQETENSSRTRGLNFSKHTPRHMLRLYTSYKLPVGNGKWTVGGGASIQSKTSSLADVKQGGYMLMNANVQYRPSENLSLALIGSNLTNRRYYENQRTRVNGGNNFYGEPRNLMFKVDYKF